MLLYTFNKYLFFNYITYYYINLYIIFTYKPPAKNAAAGRSTPSCKPGSIKQVSNTPTT